MNVLAAMRWRWLALAILALGVASAGSMTARTPTLRKQATGAFAVGRGRVRPLGFSPDGKTLVAAAQHDPVYLLDADTLVPRTQLQIRLDSAVCAFAPDGRSFAYGGWVVSSQPFARPDGLPIAQISPNITIRSARDGSILTTLDDSTYPICCQFSPDGSRLVALLSRRDRGLTVKTWETAGWTVESSLVIPSSEFHCVPALTPDGRRFALTDETGGAVVLRDVTTGQVVAKLQPEGERWASGLYWLTIAPDGSALAAGHDDGSILMWSLRDGRRLGVLRDGPVGRTRVVNMAFTPDGRRLVADYVGANPSRRIPFPFGLSRILNQGGFRDRTAQAFVVWDVTSGRRLSRVDGEGTGSASMAISPNGRTLVTSHYAGGGAWGVVLWRLD